MEATTLSTTPHMHFRVAEVDGLEVFSLVDNSVDLHSTIDKKVAQSFRQWTRKRYSEEWTRTQTQLPIAEHGFSMLIRVFNSEKSSCVLFDTGGSPEGIVENAERMGISLSEVEYIVLSHGHYDHFGGLVSALKTINKANLPLIVHEEMFRIRGTANSDGTVRIYPEFPTKEMLSSAHLISTKQPHLIANDTILVTGEIPRETSFEKGYLQHKAFINGSWQPDPLILDERAVVFNVTGKGLVIISGCAHAGIINTIVYAQKITGVPTVYGVIGGFHLAGKENENRIEQTVRELKQVKPKLVVPSHCTGWRARCSIANELTDAFVWNSVGNLYWI